MNQNNVIQNAPKIITAFFGAGILSWILSSILHFPIWGIALYLFVLWASFRKDSIVCKEIKKTSTFNIKAVVIFLIAGVVSCFLLFFVSYFQDKDLKFARTTFTISIMLTPYSLLFVQLCYRELAQRKKQVII